MTGKNAERRQSDDETNPKIHPAPNSNRAEFQYGERAG